MAGLPLSAIGVPVFGALLAALIGGFLLFFVMFGSLGLYFAIGDRALAVMTWGARGAAAVGGLGGLFASAYVFARWLIRDYRHKQERALEFDWSTREIVERVGGIARRRLSHDDIRSVACAASEDQSEVELRARGGSLSVQVVSGAGADGRVRALATDLARALDVPVLFDP